MVEEQLESKCRLCGIDESKTLAMLHLFEHENYVTKIHRVIPIAIMEFDPLPKRICYTCHYKVDEFYIFFERCLKTQELLKRQLSWCQKSDSDAVSSKQPTPLMEVIKNGAKNLNRNTLKPLLQQQQQTQKLSSSQCDSHKKVETTSTKETYKNNIRRNSNSSGKSLCSSPFNRNFSGSSSSSVSSTATGVVSSSTPSTARVDSSLPAPDSTQAALKAVLSSSPGGSSKESEDVSREKLLLTLKKNTSKTDTWSVPQTSGSKRKKLSDNQHCHSNQRNSATTETNESSTSQKGVRNSCSSSERNAFKGSNLNECNGQDLKRLSHDNLIPSSEAPHSHGGGGSSTRLSGSNESSIEIPEYLIKTTIPMSGDVYTCLHCEQTFVTQPTACSHRCDRLISMTSGSDKVDNTVGGKEMSPVYICDICDQTFSRQASLHAHHLTHYSSHLPDSDSDGNQDENRIFFGQKKKKKATIVRKVVTDEDGNYL